MTNFSRIVFRALNGIMWIDEKFRRNYNCCEKTWKSSIDQMSSMYKEGEGYRDYKDIDDISEVIHEA